MTQLLASDDAVRTIDLPDGGVRFVLPARKLGAFRWVGVALIVLPLLFALIPLSFIASMVHDGEALLFLIVPMLILLGMMVPVLLGLFVVGGHSEVEVSRTQLRYIEQCGPVRKRWSRTLSDLASLQVMRLDDPSLQTASSSGQGQMPAAIAALGVIIARSSSGKVLAIGAGYPAELLEPVAKSISERASGFVGVPIAFQVGSSRPDTDTEGTASGQPLTLDDLPAPPAGATALLQRNDTGLTIHVPPAGRRGAKGLFGFSLFWCAIMTLFTVVLAFLWLTGELEQGAWIFLVFIVGFWAIGIGMLLAALNMARRQAIIDLIGDTLVISRQSLFGTKQHEWTADQILKIIVGPSGIEVNNRPVMNLQIVPRDGKTVGLFSERDDAELHWIAQALRVGLGLRQATSTDQPQAEG